MNAEEKRLHRLQLQDDHIGRALRESEASGELRSAPSFGRPLAQDAGWEQTPDELRLPFKILKDAGVVPPEVEVMREIAELQRQLAGCSDPAVQQTLQTQISDKRQHLALRLERLRATGSL
jgi:Domain of unknown function (DUF1992)